MNRLIVLASKLAIVGFVADLVRRGWQALELKPWQVSDIAWGVVLVVVLWSMAVLLALYWLACARAAIARHQAQPDEEQV